MAKKELSRAGKDLARDIRRAKRRLLRRLVSEGEELLREEVPVRTKRLRESISSTIDYAKSRAELSVSARSENLGARTATLHLKDSTRRIRLRPVKAYNYAAVVAFGNKKSRIYPRQAKALLIPVPTRPAQGSYITQGGQTFIVRPSRRGQKPNRYDLRAAKRLKNTATRIAEKALREVFQ
jgi:hypothetical protein